MPKYSDIKLLEQLSDIAERTGDMIRYAYEDLDIAETEYATMGDDRDIDDEYVASVIDRKVDIVDLYMDAFRTELADFDKGLAKMLELRLKLAEEADLPLNLTGGKVWARNEEYTL